VVFETTADNARNAVPDSNRQLGGSCHPFLLLFDNRCELFVCVCMSYASTSFSCLLLYSRLVASDSNPSIDCSSTTPRSPRTLFDKNRRFSPLTQRYLSKEHNQANLCTASPGPQYSPKQCQLDLTSLFAPEYSFGGRGLTTDRSKYIHATVKGGYLYSARPSTSTGEINVSPAQYDIGSASRLVSPRSPRPVVSRAARFASSANGAPFVSKKHTAKSNLGMCSPGPMYNPPNESLSEKVKQRSKKARAPAGKWCP